MISFIFLGVILIIEFIIFGIKYEQKRKHKKETLTCLYRMIEYNVLNRTLNTPVTNDQATAYEYSKVFLQVEFLDAKPYLSYLFDLDECVTVGRSRDNKISIRDEQLSRMHCKFFCINETLYLQDMGSTNGTVVKGTLFGKDHVAPNNTIQIMDGDKIIIGNYRMRIHVWYGYQAHK